MNRTDGLNQWILTFRDSVNFDRIREFVIACAQVVYGNDLTRSMLVGMGKVSDEVKIKYRKAVCDDITSKILDDLFVNLPDSQNAFDKWHRETCEKIMSRTNDYDEIMRKLTYGISYGIAQKWLNMTLKDMLVIGIWDKRFETIIEYLHSPVDKYVLKAAAEFDVSPKTKKAFSRWDSYEVYIDFQNRLRDAVKKSEYNCLIEWEFGEWNKQKELHNRR